MPLPGAVAASKVDRRRTKRVGLAVLGVAALAALAVFGLRSEGSPAGGPAAPELPHETLVAPHVSIRSLTAGAHGRPSLVLFWASWCGPCKAEAAEIQRYSQTSQGSGRIVGVNWSDARPEAHSFIAHYGWTFPNMRDGDGSVGNEYKLTGLPTTFVLDGNGHIRSTLRGPQTEA